MDRTEDPGVLRNDPLAAEYARAAIADLIDESTSGFVTDDDGFEVSISEPARTARLFAGAHTITWERGVNGAGVPVRRYAARSAWEVDPSVPPSALAEALRRVLDEINHADELQGAILRRDAEAIVRAVADSAGVTL